MQLRVRIGYVLVGVTYIATISSILWSCYPLQKNWQIHPDPGSMSQFDILQSAMLIDADYCQPAVSKIDIYVTVVLNVGTDIYLISIPAPVYLLAPARHDQSNILNDSCSSRPDSRGAKSSNS